jgi:signal transduction histidine kinase
MIVRSLRWRLGIAMALLIGALVAAAGLFSSITVKREFDRYLVSQRLDEVRAAQDLLRRAPNVESGLRQVHERYGMRALVFDDSRRVVARYPPSMNEYRVVLHPGGRLEMTSGFEKLMLKGAGRRIPGKGTVYFLPPDRERPAPKSFRVSVDRGLLAGLAAAAFLAVLVVLTIFRRVFAPVEALTRGARALAGGRLDARVDVRGEDEVAELGRAFNAMAEALERNERARRNMVTDVAHELRTPLTSIRVQLEAVQDGVLEPDGKWLASIEEDATTLARLVDDLQELALADAGQLRLERCDVFVAELMARALSGLPLRGLALTRDVPSDLIVTADARRLVQVLRNLLVNATTYAKSRIAVTASARGAAVEIRVGDDGPGISDEHAERVFDRFYRADASRSRATGGAGLGLAIARQLVELHGGTIRYERPEFVITIPRVANVKIGGL